MTIEVFLKNFQNILMAVFRQTMTEHKVQVKAAHLRIAEHGIRSVVLSADSGRTSRALDERTVQACIIASIIAMETLTERTWGGASAARQWVRDGKPNVSMSMADFRRAVPGNCHHKSGWESKAKSLQTVLEQHLDRVDMVKMDDRIYFVPCM